MPSIIAFNFPIDLQIFKIKMSIKQDTMSEVKIQDINTKYVLLSITTFRVFLKKLYLIGKIFLLKERMRKTFDMH